MLPGTVAANLIVLRRVREEGVVTKSVRCREALVDAPFILRVDAGKRAMIGGEETVALNEHDWVAEVEVGEGRVLKLESEDAAEDVV